MIADFEISACNWRWVERLLSGSRIVNPTGRSGSVQSLNMDGSSSSTSPFYILVSQTSQNVSSVPALPTTFCHPTIEYHYADDSPHSLLPRTPGELVLVLDYDPADPSGFSAKSLTTELAVTGLKVTEAPGAGVVDDGVKNNNMYVLETTILPEET